LKHNFNTRIFYISILICQIPFDSPDERERVKGSKGRPSAPDERERENPVKVQSELFAKSRFLILNMFSAFLPLRSNMAA